MHHNVLRHLDMLISRYPVLEEAREDICLAYEILEQSYAKGGKLLVAGNGGSAADAEHIVSELMNDFILPRSVDAEFAEKLLAADPDLGTVLAQKLQGALPAIALNGHAALITAYVNDGDPQLCFAQQVNGYGRPGDVFLAISTSGNSKNVLYAVTVARAKGMRIVGLTGGKENKLAAMTDVCIRVPETLTYRIQELHLPVYHCLCQMLEERFFGACDQNGAVSHE